MRSVLLIVLCFLANSALSQSAIVVIDINSLQRDAHFNKLNKYELRWDSLSVERLKERINGLESSNFFLDSLSKQEQADTIRRLRETAVVYSENRSRFLLNEYVDQEFTDSLMVDRQAKAICLLEDSTVYIQTGTGIFGGVYFEINLEQNSFNSSFIIDEYKENIFKTNVEDTILASSIQVPMKKQVLYLDNELSFQNGVTIHGVLDFETVTFFRSSNFDPYLSMDAYDPNEVDKIYYLGELEFTCKLLLPEQRIEW